MASISAMARRVRPASKGGPVHRAFYQHVCFEIAVATAATSRGGYAPGAVKAFDAVKLLAALDKMVHTCKFVDPCAAEFMNIPMKRRWKRPSSIRTGFASSQTSCSRQFAHKGLNYPIAERRISGIKIT
jgi:hypothetical protein